MMSTLQEMADLALLTRKEVSEIARKKSENKETVSDNTKTQEYAVGNHVRTKGKKSKEYVIHSLYQCSDGTYWYNVSDDADNPIYLLSDEIEKV